MVKTILLASFTDKKNVNNVFSYLEEEFGIKKEDTYIFRYISNNFKLILTYRLTVEIDDRINFREFPIKTIPIHKKGETIYTINAMNKLIERDSGLTKGNIDYKAYKINWENYKNKLILLKGDDLAISDIVKTKNN